ncbi:MAG: hypothetical protein JST80_06425 [Bdellovibrionales bacterium]|nr:hypothetical protein [Bdellovibrionales bacterium]
MNKFQLFSLMALAVSFLAGCGNSNQNPAAYMNGYGATNPYGAGYYGQSGYGTYGGGSYQTPLYSGNQLIGYKVRTALVGGTYSNLTPGTPFTQSVQVNAGDRLFINLSNAMWAARIYCDRKLINTYDNKSGRLTNIAINLNGQNIGGGYGGAVTVPAAGTLTVVVDTSQIASSISCGWSGDRPFQVLGMAISLGGGYGAGYPYSYGQSTGAAVEAERCTNTGGAAMACPY